MSEIASLATIIPSLTHLSTIAVPVSLPFSWAINCACRTHSLWKNYKRAQEITQHPSNFALALGGQALDLFLRDNLLVSIPARGLLIARRVLEYIEAKDALTMSFAKWRAAFTKKASYEPQHYYNFKNWKILSISNRASFTLSFNQMAERVCMIFHQTQALLRDLFVLCMCYMEAMGALSFSENTKSEAVQDCLLNAHAFIQKFIHYKDAFPKVLTSLGVKKEISLAITTTHETLGIAHRFYQNTLAVKERALSHLSLLTNNSY